MLMPDACHTEACKLHDVHHAVLLQSLHRPTSLVLFQDRLGQTRLENESEEMSHLLREKTTMFNQDEIQ